MKQKAQISKENNKYDLNILEFTMSTIIPVFDCVQIIRISKGKMRRERLK